MTRPQLPVVRKNTAVPRRVLSACVSGGGRTLRCRAGARGVFPAPSITLYVRAKTCQSAGTTSPVDMGVAEEDSPNFCACAHGAAAAHDWAGTLRLDGFCGRNCE
ncbi:hypothetical protein EVG20_g6173 [Dentipellis fragilis]|uniref:Uncharacterized protein n=1 Tax=Dentipellis fragilis TaxID=205917 RepID=A0A4Y9YRT5_9AGAM|nr:hypothetical protein EVG20_g6173 [Dentipellis fragilis]